MNTFPARFDGVCAANCGERVCWLVKPCRCDQ